MQVTICVGGTTLVSLIRCIVIYLTIITTNTDVIRLYIIIFWDRYCCISSRADKQNFNYKFIVFLLLSSLGSKHDPGTGDQVSNRFYALRDASALGVYYVWD